MAAGKKRSSLLFAAAQSYLAAARLQPSSYALINGATLASLSGDADSAGSIARQVLDLIEAQPDEPETPYYRAATRAEALLLLGRVDEARAAFGEAIALAPRAWEDHAATLRQFRLILDAQGKDSAWLDPYRPPRSLHFGGHMSFAASVERREGLEADIATLLAEEDVGFGYGALAAGADIIIAEALLARGAELHAILPGGRESFAVHSVVPFGEGWRRRFEAVLAESTSVRPVRPLGAAASQEMVGLADEVAMGAAAMNGRRLESSAVQLLVLPEDAASASDRSMQLWAASGRRQRLLLAPREIAAPRTAVSGDAQEGKVMAVLAVGLSAPSGPRATEAALARLKPLLSAPPAPAIAPYWSEGKLLLALTDCGGAAAAALRLLAADPSLRIGGHYGLATVFTDPFSGQQRLAPDATGPATAAMDSTPPGTACVTDDFAAALAAAGPRSPATEYVGELDAPDRGPPIGLHALKSYDQLFEPLWGDDAQ